MKNCIIFLMVICIFLCGCVKEDENIVSKTQQIDNIREEEITCVIEVRDIEQWAIDNKGEFPSFLGNLNSWEWDEKEFSSHGTFLTGIMCAKNDRFNGVFVNSKCKVMCVKALEGESLSFSTFAYNDKLYECMKKSKMLFITPSANQGLELCDELMVYPA
ncbi:MAG: hypothetical protein IJC76_02155 [Lachnospiraceae bacterium]|nr:hypothetical protein [Lachnospiraceae bacterium]